MSIVLVSITLVPNYNYGKDKRKNSYENKADGYYQQLTNDITNIYSFAFNRTITQRIPLYDSRGRPLYDRNGNAISEQRTSILRNKFYSRDQRLLSRYRDTLVLRNIPNSTVFPIIIENTIDENISDMVDNRVLQTVIDFNTQIETFERYVPL